MTDHRSPNDDNPVSQALEADAMETRKGRYGILGAIVAIFFALFFAYDLFEAIGNVIGVVGGINHTNQISKDLGLAPSATIPWAILIAGLRLAPGVYALASLVGRGHGVLAKAAIFLMALAVAAALILGIEEGFSKLL